jgi:hypothetical protein
LVGLHVPPTTRGIIINTSYFSFLGKDYVRCVFEYLCPRCKKDYCEVVITEEENLL